MADARIFGDYTVTRFLVRMQKSAAIGFHAASATSYQSYSSRVVMPNEESLHDFQELDSSELHVIWTKGDRNTWSEESLEVIEKILRDRGVDVHPQRLGLDAGYASARPGLKLRHRLMIFFGAWILLLAGLVAFVELNLGPRTIAEYLLALKHPAVLAVTSLLAFFFSILWPSHGSAAARGCLVMIFLVGPVLALFLIWWLFLLAHRGMLGGPMS